MPKTKQTNQNSHAQKRSLRLAPPADAAAQLAHLVRYQKVTWSGRSTPIARLFPTDRERCDTLWLATAAIFASPQSPPWDKNLNGRQSRSGGVTFPGTWSQRLGIPRQKAQSTGLGCCSRAFNPFGSLHSSPVDASGSFHHPTSDRTLTWHHNFLTPSPHFLSLPWWNNNHGSPTPHRDRPVDQSQNPQARTPHTLPPSPAGILSTYPMMRSSKRS